MKYNAYSRTEHNIKDKNEDEDCVKNEVIFRN